MYAIVFDLNPDLLRLHHPIGSLQAAYFDISKVFIDEFKFKRQQDNIFYTHLSNGAVSSVLVAQELASRFEWFSFSVEYIRMLQIEANHDLMPAIGMSF
jgi:virulence-associated protein VapD